MNTQFLPIAGFLRTDAEAQPLLLLRTSSGRVYEGEWDDCSGYFFALSIVQGEHPAHCELPGRMYDVPVEFAFKETDNE